MFGRKDKGWLYKTLFLSTLSLSAFTVGGGYVIVPLIKEKFVNQLGLIEEEEMQNMIIIAQSAPGPIAVNTSILLGYRLGGVFGVLAAVLGTLLPPLITISLISYFYHSFKDKEGVKIFLRGLQIGAAVLIINVVIKMGKSIFQKDALLHGLITALAFVAAFFFRINVMLIILVSALIGTVRVLFEKKIRQKEEK